MKFDRPVWSGGRDPRHLKLKLSTTQPKVITWRNERKRGEPSKLDVDIDRTGKCPASARMSPRPRAFENNQRREPGAVFHVVQKLMIRVETRVSHESASAARIQRGLAAAQLARCARNDYQRRAALDAR